MLKPAKGSKPGLPHTVSSSCPVCGSRLQICGPIWNGPLHDHSFLPRLIEEVKIANEAIYKSKSRLIGMLSVAYEELSFPLYVSIPEICHVAKSPQPPMNAIMY